MVSNIIENIRRLEVYMESRGGVLNLNLCLKNDLKINIFKLYDCLTS